MRTQYIADDGKCFNDKDECARYEARLTLPPSTVVAKNVGDAAFLRFIYERMQFLGENYLMDYMHTLKDFITLFEMYGYYIEKAVREQKQKDREVSIVSGD